MPFPYPAVLAAAALLGIAEPPAEKPTAPAAPEPDKPAVGNPATPFPHPIITEVLYAVPSGDTGDANGDGNRQATGDEFVELFNPHDKPISLRGYTIADKSAGKPGSLKFVFPACTLQPGQCAVVFNGFECTWPGTTEGVGDSMQAPKGGHTKFGGALVFSMKVDSSRNAFSNSGDCALLIAPDGNALEVVKWGKVDKAPTAKASHEAPTTNRGSVQRSSATGPFAAHEGVGSPVLRYSPGVFPPGAKPAATPPAPPEKAPTKKPGK